MSEEKKENIVEQVASRVGYTFKNEKLAAEALIHKSFFNEHAEEPGHNERLEFLGDAVIDLLVAEELMHLMPDAPEGELTKCRAALVNEDNLSKIARELDLGTILRLGKGEEKNNGRSKPSILSDVVESVAGAIYFDGGFEAVKETVLAWFAASIIQVIGGKRMEDPKTLLQEYFQIGGKIAPLYQVIGESGPDHRKMFEVKLASNGETLATGRGYSKKDAEKDAAAKALLHLSKEEI